MNPEVRRKLFRKARAYALNRRKLVRFHIPFHADRPVSLEEGLELLAIEGYTKDPTMESDVWVENEHDAVPPKFAPMMALEDYFWDGVYAYMSDEGNSIRVGDGILLGRLLQHLYTLERGGLIRKHETSSFDEMYRQLPKSCLKSSSSNETEDVTERCKITFIYYGNTRYVNLAPTVPQWSIVTTAHLPTKEDKDYPSSSLESNFGTSLSQSSAGVEIKRLAGTATGKLYGELDNSTAVSDEKRRSDQTLISVGSDKRDASSYKFVFKGEPNKPPSKETVMLDVPCFEFMSREPSSAGGSRCSEQWTKEGTGQTSGSDYYGDWKSEVNGLTIKTLRAHNNVNSINGQKYCSSLIAEQGSEASRKIDMLSDVSDNFADNKKLFAQRAPGDFKVRLIQALDDFLVRKELVTSNLTYETTCSLTINKKKGRLYT